MAHPDVIKLGDIQRFSNLLADAAASVDLATPVPTCDGWSMADLVWHVTEVQDFWTFIISNRPATPQQYERPERASEPRLVANLRNATDGLLAALETASPEETAWSWAAEQTVGFTMRRQVHEALTHCIDGLLTAGRELPEVVPELAADGIDEIFGVMLDDLEDAPGEVVLHATDTDDRWTLALGSGSCQIAGRALTLNLWLWGRVNASALLMTGDIEQATRLRETINAKTQ